MDKGVAYIITFVVCAILQVAIAPNIVILGAEPLFIVIPVFLVALKSGPTSGGVAGFLCGLFYDFIGNGTIGAMTLALTLVAYGIGWLANALSSQSPLIMVGVSVVGPLLVELFFGLAMVIGGAEGASFIGMLVSTILPSTLYTAVLCCIALLTINLVVGESTTPGLGSLGGGMSMPKMPKSNGPRFK